MRTVERRMGWAAAFTLAVAACGCRSGLPSPASAGIDIRRLSDPSCPPAGSLVNAGDLERVAAHVRRHPPATTPPRKSVLTLSGGGSNGAYTAGVLVGWSELGSRPCFDVITGSSVGALIGAMIFPGPDQDGPLREFFTTVRTADVYRRRLLLVGLLSESLADSAPLARKIEQIVTPEYLARVAAEHAAGRRLYVGTTELESRRLVVWDMGAIASRGTPDACRLYQTVLLASASVPALLPPVRVPVTVDGRPFEERHVDGATTAAVFLRLPRGRGEAWVLGPGSPYHGSDLYAIVAGKLYADPAPVRVWAPTVAANSIITLTYAQQRYELRKLYDDGVLNGMNFHLAAIPEDYPHPPRSTEFDPDELARLFEEGRRQILTGRAWRATPPGFGPGERVQPRGSGELRVEPDATPPAAGAGRVCP